VVAIVDLIPEVRGDTIIYDLTLSRVGATPGWMNGGYIKFMVKFRVADPDNLAIFTKSTPASGIVWVDQASVTPTATLTINKTDYPDSLIGLNRSLPYEVEIEDGTGRRETVQRGTLPILADVVRGS
jgi:hypothetical protein